MTDLDQLRKVITELDDEILKLLELRTGVVRAVGEYKKEKGLPIYVPEVEEKKIKTLSAKCTCPGLVETIWPVIMCYSRSVE